MNIAAAMVYWVIVPVWLTVLGTIAVLYIRNPNAFGATRLLLIVLAIDTLRNIVENTYFGLYFGGLYGLLSSHLIDILGSPVLLLLPKALNIVAGCLVLGLLLLRWLPVAVRERSVVEHNAEIAQNSARLKDEFIATVSHELRTPLTAMTASLALLEETKEADLPEETKELIAIAHTSSRRLRHLVDDILDIEKLEAGKVDFRFQRVEVGKALKEEIESNQSLAKANGVKLRLDVAQSRAVNADPHRLKQVISNLLSNAIKFSPPEEEVLLRAENRGNTVRISVRDHGAGIPEEFTARIFEKFAQADMSDSRPKTGTGLGLSIVKEIVQRLGGEIGFAGVPDGGTIFFVDLPAMEIASADERQTEVA